MSKIKELPVYPEHKEMFTCKRCGCNFGRRVVLITHKFGGPGIGFASTHVCGNCLNGTEFKL